MESGRGKQEGPTMTILIKGMEMPENCEKCPFLDYEEGFCFASGEKIKSGWYVSTLYSGSPEFNTMRNPKCPLIEVPTPHGRLIDADDFDSRIRAAGGPADEELTDDFKDGVLSVLTLMKTQNTVIEEEEG